MRLRDRLLLVLLVLVLLRWWWRWLRPGLLRDGCRRSLPRRTLRLGLRARRMRRRAVRSVGGHRRVARLRPTNHFFNLPLFE